MVAKSVGQHTSVHIAASGDRILRFSVEKFPKRFANPELEIACHANPSLPAVLIYRVNSFRRAAADGRRAKLFA
jgi:hypothetical protein